MPESLPSNVVSVTPLPPATGQEFTGAIDYRDGCMTPVLLPDGGTGYQYQILAPAGEATPNRAVRADDPRIPSSPPPAGVTATVPLAALTPGGSQGSLTITGGVVTAVTAPS